MQQNQDNLTDENPYSPPKSEDFMLPENDEQNFQHTKKQMIYRVIFATFFLPIIYILLSLLWFGIFSDAYEAYEGIKIEKSDIIFDTLKNIVLFWIVQWFLFFYLIEKRHFYRLKKLDTLSFLGALFLGMTYAGLAKIFIDTKVNFPELFVAMLFMTFSLFVPIWITLVLLRTHSRYCCKKSIQAT